MCRHSMTFGCNESCPFALPSNFARLPLGFPMTLLLSLHSSRSISVTVTGTSFIPDLEPMALKIALLGGSIHSPPHPFLEHVPYSEHLKLKAWDLEPMPRCSRVVPSHYRVSLYRFNQPVMETEENCSFVDYAQVWTIRTAWSNNY